MQITDYVIADIQTFVPLNYNYGSYLTLCKKNRNYLCGMVHDISVSGAVLMKLAIFPNQITKEFKAEIDDVNS